MGFPDYKLSRFPYAMVAVGSAMPGSSMSSFVLMFSFRYQIRHDRKRFLLKAERDIP